MQSDDVQPEADRLLKIKLSDNEQKAVRIAAAIQDLTMGDFARHAVVAAALQATRDFNPNVLELDAEKPRRKRKSKN